MNNVEQFHALTPEDQEIMAYTCATPSYLTADRKDSAIMAAPVNADFIRWAKRNYHEEGVIEVDDKATVSKADGETDGAYVQAWVWVSNDDAAAPANK